MAKYMARDRWQDLLHDAVADMLHLGSQCRMETHKIWMQTVLRRSHFAYNRYMSQEKRAAKTVQWTDDDDRRTTPPPQEHALDLSMALDVLSALPYGDIVMRRATGVHLKEIGAERGTNKEAVRQLEAKTRRKMKEILNEV